MELVLNTSTRLHFLYGKFCTVYTEVLMIPGELDFLMAEDREWSSGISEISSLSHFSFPSCGTGENKSKGGWKEDIIESAWPAKPCWQSQVSSSISYWPKIPTLTWMCSVIEMYIVPGTAARQKCWNQPKCGRGRAVETAPWAQRLEYGWLWMNRL